MTVQLGELAALVNGRLLGNPHSVCEGANPPADAAQNEVTLLDDPRRSAILDQSQAMAVVTAVELEIDSTQQSMAQIIVDNPHLAFGKIVALYRPPIEACCSQDRIDASATICHSTTVHHSAIVGAGVEIGSRCKIMPGVVILPQTKIGDDCTIHANVTLYEYTRIADRVVIHSGSVIGSHGFGYRQVAGRHVPTAQLGYVSIESDVEIGACVTIDRGTYGATRIGLGTKIDNHVMIAHNCVIGRHNLICSQVGIAGSCRTGDYVVLAGQVGLKDHVSLGDHSIVGAQAGIMDDCPGNEVYLGSPATPQREQMQIMAVQRRLPDMRRELKQLRRDVDRLAQLPADQKRSA